MIFLIADVILSYFIKYPTFLVLLNLVFINKRDVAKLIIIS